MEDHYVLVSDGKNTYEIELEDDESVTLRSLRSFFGPGAIGLGYNNSTTGRFRILRLENEAIVRPRGGWDLFREYVVCRATSCNDQESPILFAENCGTSQGLLIVCSTKFSDIRIAK